MGRLMMQLEFLRSKFQRLLSKKGNWRLMKELDPAKIVIVAVWQWYSCKWKSPILGILQLPSKVWLRRTSLNSLPSFITMFAMRNQKVCHFNFKAVEMHGRQNSSTSSQRNSQISLADMPLISQVFSTTCFANRFSASSQLSGPPFTVNRTSRQPNGNLVLSWNQKEMLTEYITSPVTIFLVLTRVFSLTSRRSYVVSCCWKNT